MSQEEDSSGLRRLQADARWQDPEVRRRMSEASKALSQNAAFVRATSSITESLAPALKLITDSINTWIQNLDLSGLRVVVRAVGDAFLRLIPPNARELGVEYWPALQLIGAEEQLCLSWVPDLALARSLIDAHDAAARDAILVAAANEVLEACSQALAEVRSKLHAAELDDELLPPQLMEVARLIDAAILAAKEGHHQAAQALATCVTDTLLTQHVSDRKVHSFMKAQLKRVAAEEQFAVVVLGPTLAAAESAFRQASGWDQRQQSGESPPYSRNATVHAAGLNVFTEVGALKAVILATSVMKMSVSTLLWFLGESIGGSLGLGKPQPSPSSLMDG